MDRRAFLQIGLSGITSLGWSPVPIVQRRKLILVWLGGGHAATETFDPKYNAPDEIRGPFKAIQTSVPGLQFSELFPRLAQVAHRLAVFRTVTVRNGDHYNASHELLTHNRSKPTLANHVGRGSTIPYMVCEAQPPCSYIEQAHKGDWVKIDYRNGRYWLPSLVPDEPLGDRGTLLKALETTIPRTERYDAQREAAFDLLRGGGPLEACVKISVHDRLRYGGSSLGECVLLAKRLTEAGAGAVTIIAQQNDGWDLHRDLFDRYKPLTTSLDMAMERLITELADDTVCLVCSEFGRTPKINDRAGRDHWPQANTALLFGAGIRPGIIGRTDNMLMPKDRPVPAAWLSNTVRAACGDTTIAANELVNEVLA